MLYSNAFGSWAPSFLPLTYNSVPGANFLGHQFAFFRDLWKQYHYSIGILRWSGISSGSSATTGRPCTWECKTVPFGWWTFFIAGAKVRNSMGLDILGAKLKAVANESKGSKEPTDLMCNPSGIPWSCIDKEDIEYSIIPSTFLASFSGAYRRLVVSW